MPWLKTMEFDAQGKLTVLRDAAEVFREETIASFQGKPVTIDHPANFVDPDNWSELAKGTTQNVRRGEREQADLLLADLMITDAEAIAFVESGDLRQISVGYDAEYEQVSPGVARQKDIIANHNALVQRGRAGVRCMIMDSAKENELSKIKDKFMSMFRKTLDEMSEEDLSELKKEKTSDADGDIGERLDKMQKAIDALVESDKEVHKAMDCWQKTKDAEDEEKKKHEEEESKKKEDEEKEAVKDKKTKDCASRAEILAPGIAIAGKTTDSIMREALTIAANTHKDAVETFTGGAEIAKLSGPTLDMAFVGASALIGSKNNRSFLPGKGLFKQTNAAAEMNAANKKFWNR